MIINPNQNEKPQAAPLSPDEVGKLGGALTRLDELASFSVKTAAHEAEEKGLTQYVAETFRQHALEFIGMWFTAHEYRGLVQSQARHERRVNAFKQLVEAHEARQAAAEEAAK